MTTHITACAALLLLVTSAVAGPRLSQNYVIPTETYDAGGGRSASASYTNNGSLGLMTGVSSVAAPAGTVKAGYIGQLYEIAGFLVSAAPSTLEEGSARQLEPRHLLDDATYLAIDPTQVSWSVLSGPITAISTSGLATAGIVYQNTSASVQGTYQSTPSSFGLTVLNVGVDDFESYAGDLIGDAWQVLYFGLPPNPAAGPLLDPDGDGQDNRFEFLAGLVPTDPNSFFKLRIEKAAPPSNAKMLIFGPRFSDRTYTVQFRLSLTVPPVWTTLNGTSFLDSGLERTVTEPNATGTKFYRVEITKP